MGISCKKSVETETRGHVKANLPSNQDFRRCSHLCDVKFSQSVIPSGKSYHVSPVSRFGQAAFVNRDYIERKHV